MENQVCPQCGSPLKLVPAGVSKAGKNYPAFWSCTNRDCKYTFNTPTVTTRPAYAPPVPAPNPYPTAPVPPVAPVANSGNREDSINWLNAKNNACLLIAHHPKFAKVNEDIKITIENLTYFLHKTTLVSVSKKLAPDPTPPPPSPPDNSDIDNSEIPF